VNALQALVFDFDGVLADTEPLHLRAFQDTLADRGIALSPDDYAARYLGYDDRGVFRALAADLRVGWSEDELSRLVAVKMQVFRELVASQPLLFPGVSERLRDWSMAVPIAVASGAFREEIDLVLVAAGLRDAVSVVVAAGETPRGKPAPDPYVRALALLASGGGRTASARDIDPARAVAVEDSVWGISSARAAGMKVAALATSYAAARLGGADLVLASFEELSLEVFEALVSAQD
jgi:beta-phosphoglucomutase